MCSAYGGMAIVMLLDARLSYKAKPFFGAEPPVPMGTGASVSKSRTPAAYHWNTLLSILEDVP